MGSTKRQQAAARQVPRRDSKSAGARTYLEVLRSLTGDPEVLAAVDAEEKRLSDAGSSAPRSR